MGRTSIVNQDPCDPDRHDDPLKLDRCPDCGYPLIGLAERGLCPECGFAYSDDMIILYGWGFANRASLANSRWIAGNLIRLMALPAGGFVVTAAMFWLMFCTLRSMLTPWQALKIVLPLTAMVWLPSAMQVVLLIRDLRWRSRLGREGVAPVQVRLFREGFAQRRGFGPVTAKAWQQRRVRIDALGLDAREPQYRCSIDSLRFWGIPVSRNPVDIELYCDHGAAHRLRERLHQWGVLDTRPPRRSPAKDITGASRDAR